MERAITKATPKGIKEAVEFYVNQEIGQFWGIEGKLRPDFVLAVDEKWAEWVGTSWGMNPQQMRRENEQKYKRKKCEFERQGEGEQNFIVEIAVP